MADITVVITEQVAEIVQVLDSAAIIVETPATQGLPGPIGETGATGATWFNDAGVPSTAIGRVGDYYLNSDNGDIYNKTGATTWVFVMSIAVQHTRLHAMTSTDDHSAGNYKLFYSDGSGHIQELAHGDSGYYLKSNGATSAPTWAEFEDYITETEFTTYSGTLQTQINNKPDNFLELSDTPDTYSVGLFAQSTVDGVVWTAAAPALDYVLETEFATYSGTLQTQIDNKPTTFLGLTDTPDTYDNDKYAKSTTSGIVWATVSGTGGASSFIELIDTPDTYDDGKFAKSTATGVEWADVPAAGVSEAELITCSGVLNSKVDTVSGDITTTSGTLQTNINAKLGNIVEDTTPQLGGDLSTNGYDILFGTDTISGTGTIITGDHGTATIAQVVNVVYGTGAAPAANTTTEGTLFIKYTA
jgi:hypothetical protein